ncbi:hypothetical protein SAMN02745116_01496 [Pilibacter termitis]|uniref:Uncharacterized protein n=1 Tax=Pilibacter termitis TaxID=263852 RepID=A0A1T4NR64_9ENTE|nr:hypothetical protein SAMN02745116_01496 [Pilibacter termitis]
MKSFWALFLAGTLLPNIYLTPVTIVLASSVFTVIEMGLEFYFRDEENEA